MSPGSGTESYPAFAGIGLRENTGKNLNQYATRDAREMVQDGATCYHHTGHHTMKKNEENKGREGEIECGGIRQRGGERKGVGEAKEVERSWRRKKRNIPLTSGLRLRWAGHVARMGESRNASRVLVGRPERKRPLGRPRYRWEDKIKIDLSEVEYDASDWINLVQERDRWRAYVRVAMNLRVL
ncbi:hypothetical protein ANN_12187 [Periplaneta americana]|uniref:Uncharacterized protein n=1 Tax=Periplaneta americana TaxID=6978 RepID=A0ABQ8THV8_PERAM|nr:hypothetical protein ANN_12187 [Periplaneta americana]